MRRSWLLLGLAVLQCSLGFSAFAAAPKILHVTGTIHGGAKGLLATVTFAATRKQGRCMYLDWQVDGKQKPVTTKNTVQIFAEDGQYSLDVPLQAGGLNAAYCGMQPQRVQIDVIHANGHAHTPELESEMGVFIQLADVKKERESITVASLPSVAEIQNLLCDRSDRSRSSGALIDCVIHTKSLGALIPYEAFFQVPAGVDTLRLDVRAACPALGPHRVKNIERRFLSTHIVEGSIGRSMHLLGRQEGFAPTGCFFSFMHHQFDYAIRKGKPGNTLEGMQIHFFGAPAMSGAVVGETVLPMATRLREGYERMWSGNSEEVSARMTYHQGVLAYETTTTTRGKETLREKTTARIWVTPDIDTVTRLEYEVTEQPIGIEGLTGEPKIVEKIACDGPFEPIDLWKKTKSCGR